jgi:hypothetical protein
VVEMDDELLRDAGISGNHSGVTDSRSRSHREEESGRNEGQLIEVWNQPEPQPRRSIIEGLMPDGALTILFGDGGLGKSYLALYIATCVCLGTSIAGRPVEQGPVLYLDAELDEDEFIRRSYAVARGLGFQQPPEGLYYWRLTGSLTNETTLRQVRDYHRACGPRLTIIDSLTVGSHGIDPKEAREIIALLKGLESLGTILALDHIRTPEPGSDTTDFRPFGSAFKHHLARSLIMVTKAPTGALALRNTKANFDPKASPIYVSLNINREDRIVGVEWLDSGDARLAGMTSIPPEERVYQALARSENRTSAPDTIANELGIAPKTVSNHLTTLRVRGRAEPLGDGRWRFLPDSLSKGTGNGKG